MRRAAGTPLLMLTLASSLAIATARPAAADDKATREAQARFEEGLARVKSGDLEAARMSFTQAYAVLHKPDILWNLALAEQKTGHALEALGHFKQVQAAAKSDRDRASASKHVTELMSQTAHLEVAAPSGSQITLDGSGAGVAPLPEPLDVTPGKHHVEIHTAQGVNKAADADAAIGQTAHVSFLQADGNALAAPAPTPSPAADPSAIPPPAPAPDTSTPPPSGKPFWDARTITVASLGSLAVVSAGLGLAFGVVSNGDSNTASTLRSQNPSCGSSTSSGCQQLASTTQSQHTAYVTSEAFWIASGVLVVGAVGTWFLWPKASTSGGAAGIQVVPTAGAGGAGAAAVGWF